jgi:hypothetical protein
MLLIVLAGAVQAQGEAPELQSSTDRSDTGSYTLSWSATGDVDLQEARRADFSDAQTLYRGPDQATVVSGRLNGTYHYRLLRNGKPWGRVVRVEVAHHSLGEATAFLAAGAIVFVATVILILHGHRRHRQAFPRPGGVTS